MPYTALNPRPKRHRVPPPRLDREAISRAGDEAHLIEATLRRWDLKPVHLGRLPQVSRPLPVRTPRVAIAV